jgi:hypothetical protein
VPPENLLDERQQQSLLYSSDLSNWAKPRSEFLRPSQARLYSQNDDYGTSASGAARTLKAQPQDLISRERPADGPANSSQ